MSNDYLARTVVRSLSAELRRSDCNTQLAFGDGLVAGDDIFYEGAMKYFIVWNEAKTVGFVTTDEQLAYEVRKGSDANCFDRDGNVSYAARGFCDDWYNDNCTIEEVIRG